MRRSHSFRSEAWGCISKYLFRCGGCQKTPPLCTKKTPRFLRKKPLADTQKKPKFAKKPPKNAPKNTRLCQTTAPLTLPEWTPTSPMCTTKNTLSSKESSCFPHLCYSCGGLCTEKPIWLPLVILKKTRMGTSEFLSFHHAGHT